MELVLFVADSRIGLVSAADDVLATSVGRISIPLTWRGRRRTTQTGVQAAPNYSGGFCIELNEPQSKAAVLGYGESHRRRHRTEQAKLASSMPYSLR